MRGGTAFFCACKLLLRLLIHVDRKGLINGRNAMENHLPFVPHAVGRKLHLHQARGRKTPLREAVNAPPGARNCRGGGATPRNPDCAPPDQRLEVKRRARQRDNGGAGGRTTLSHPNLNRNAHPLHLPSIKPSVSPLVLSGETEHVLL